MSPDAPTTRDRALVRDLEACAIAKGAFTHADHVRAAWAMLREQPLAEVVPRFAATLERFARHHDAPDLYHETITQAYLTTIDDRIRAEPRPPRWSEFRRKNPDLFIDYREFLERHYSPAVLDSARAKQEFVAADRAPLAAGRTRRAGASPAPTSW